MKHGRPRRSASAPSYESLLAGSLQGVLIAGPRRIELANAAAAALFGAESAQALAGLPLAALFDPADVARLRAAVQAQGDPAEGGALAVPTGPMVLAVRGLRLDGRALSLEAAVLPTRWGDAAALQIALLDRTELLETRAALQEREQEFRHLIDGSLQGIYVHVEHRFLFVNKTFADMFGYDSVQELLAMGDVTRCYAPDEVERMLGFYRARIGGGSPPVRYEFEGLRKDGSTIWLENQVRVVSWAGRQAILATVIDISERKLAERRLQASEERYRNVVENSVQGIVIQRQGRALFANQSFADQFGFDSPGEVLALASLSVLVAEDFRERMATYARARLRGEAVPKRYVGHGLRSDGTDVWLDTMVTVVDWEGAPAIQTSVVDVTERVRAERELQAQQRVLEAVFNTIPHSLYVKDASLRYLMVNRSFCEVVGLPQERIVGQRISALGIVGDRVSERIEAADRQVMADGKLVSHYDMTMAMTRAGAGPTRRHVIKYPLRGEHGETVGIVGITEDVTERLAAEEGLRASERLLRTVIDTLPHAIFVRDRAGRYQVVNKALVEHRNLPAEALLGKTLRDFPRDWTPQLDRLHQMDQQVLSEGRTVEAPDVALQRGDGRTSRYRIVKIPLQDDEGNVTGLLGISEDITERKQAEEELRANRLLLQTVFNLLPLWVFVKDAQRRFLMINRKMAQDYALDADVQPGALVDLAASITEEEKSVIYELDRQVLDSGDLIEVPEVQITLPQGETRLYRTVRMPLRDADGAVAGIVGIAEDITERKRIEQAIQQAQKLESLGVLAGGVAHDFNNLLVSILGNASLALMDLPPDSAARATIAQIETAGQRAAELCRQLLAYAGKASFEIASVNLNALIEEMTQLLRVSLAKPIELTYAFDPELPPVEVDPTQIRQVVMNLVMNAAEAIGPRPGAITLTTRVVDADRALLRSYIQGDRLVEGPCVVLEVRDTGEGIPHEMLGRIFDPFFTTKFTGRGLGLAAVLGIVHGHQGAVRVVSAPGEGSTFHLLLPAQEGLAAVAPAGRGASRWRARGVALLIEEESTVGEVLRRMLVSFGLSVVLAADGTEALAALAALAAPKDPAQPAQQAHEAQQVRVIVFDLTSQARVAAATLSALRRHDPRLPMLLLSAVPEAEVRRRVGSAGMTGVLEKPFTRNALSQKLQALLG